MTSPEKTSLPADVWLSLESIRGQLPDTMKARLDFNRVVTFMRAQEDRKQRAEKECAEIADAVAVLFRYKPDEPLIARLTNIRVGDA